MIRNVYAQRFALIEVAYDPYQLESLCADLMRDGVIQCVPFSQLRDRLEADKYLYDTIFSRRIWHDGNADLRRHIDNANRKVDPESRKLRIVKREESLKIDLGVCLSMALYSAQKVGL
jgi:phage terminase large subunit-like protein